MIQVNLNQLGLGKGKHMQRDRPRKTVTVALEEAASRTAFALLAGKLRLRQMLEGEIQVIRTAVKDGSHPEWLALLPGLDMEVRATNEDLQVMQKIVVGSELLPVTRRESGGGTKKQIAAPTAGKEVDVNSLIVIRQSMGKPVLTVTILQWLLTRSELQSGEFLEANPGVSMPTLSTAILRLAKRGLRLKRQRGGWKLACKLTGQLGEATPEKSVVVASVAGAAPLTKKTILLTEFAMNKNRISFKDLVRKYEWHRNDPHTLISWLKRDGYRFTAQGNSVFTLDKTPAKNSMTTRAINQ